jgi:spermidine synthase
MISSPKRPIIYAITIALAACSLLYELLIAQTLAILAANTVVWYCLTIGVYLAGMGLGALAHEKYPTKNSWGRLFRVELMLCLLGALAVPILHFAHTFGLLFYLAENNFLTNIIFFGTAFFLITSIGLLTGFELPLLIDLGNSSCQENKVTNRVLASDYLGSLLAGFAFPILLIPNFDLITVGLFTASINLVIASFTLWWIYLNYWQTVKRLCLCCALAAVMLASFFSVSTIEQYFAKKYYYYWDYGEEFTRFMGSMSDVEDVARTRSPYQNIDLVYDKEGFYTDFLIDIYSTKFVENEKQPRDYVLFLNGDFQLTSNYEEYYHEYFAHVPIAASGAAPKRVLVMGAGDGLLFRELVKYKEIEKIVHVDLDRKLVELARSHPVLTAMNENALEDPRIETYFADAYNYIRHSTETFDAIYLDFPYARDYNLSRLFSREFFHFARARLTRDGFLVMDAPGLEQVDIDWKIYSNTLLAAGFEHIHPYVSYVEEFNQEAFDFIMESNTEDDPWEAEEAKNALLDLSIYVRTGFVIAKNSKHDTPIYWDENIKRHVLTRERLNLTLKKKFPSVERIDEGMINSILKPTLPVSAVWNIRKPW